MASEPFLAHGAAVHLVRGQEPAQAEAGSLSGVTQPAVGEATPATFRAAGSEFHPRACEAGGPRHFLQASGEPPAIFGMCCCVPPFLDKLFPKLDWGPSQPVFRKMGARGLFTQSSLWL